MSTTVNNNEASSSSTSASNNAESLKEHMFSSNTNSRSQRTHDDSDTENEQSDDESRNNVDVPTDYELSDTLLGQYKHMVNNQGLLFEEECILKKGISVSSTVKNNDTDLLIVEKRINDSLKPLFLMSSMLSFDSSNVDVELIIYLAQSAIVLAVNTQSSLSRVRRNNIAKEIYGPEVLLTIKIKDTPKMFDETETERVRKLAKSIRKNNEAKQSLLKLDYHSKSNAKMSVNSNGNNTTGNSSNSKSSSGSNGRSNNFNGSSSNVASEEQEVHLSVGGRLFHHKQVWKELGLPNFCQEVLNGLKVHLLPNFKPMPNPIPFSIPEGPKSGCITEEVQNLLLDDAIEQVLPNRYSKRVFYFNVFTVPKPGTNLHRPVLDFKRFNTYINNQSFKMEGIKNLPSMKAYLHVLVDPQYRDLFRFVWKGSHYRWKTMSFGLSTAPRIFTMLLRPVLLMLRDINVSVIAYLDDLLIFGSTKEECLSNLKKTMDLLVKLVINKFICFHSRKLTDTQSIGDREFLSIIDSLKKFQYYKLVKRFQSTLITKILHILHISGKKNGIADFLSRRINQLLTVIRHEKEFKYSGHRALGITYNNIRQFKYTGKELNNYEIEFLKLGLENAKSLKFMQQILDFFKNNTNAINEIRYTTKYMDSIFLPNLPIDGESSAILFDIANHTILVEVSFN
ncbi:hypothetical protein ACTFIW_000774 [Dictyostelium discoideum]